MAYSQSRSANMFDQFEFPGVFINDTTFHAKMF
jgi:hypothetical protein